MVIPHYINATIGDHPFMDYWDIFVLKRRNPYNVALHVLGMYTFTGRFHLRPPAPLALWLPDRLIPFIDWTIWVYASQFLLLYGCFLGVKSATVISRLVYAISMASLVAFCVFLIYPTKFPRNLAAKEGSPTFAFRFLYSIDSAANCFPLLHVALAWLSALVLRDERKKAGALAMVWAAIISISTLTTKQHYFVDLVGGGWLALLCRWLIGQIWSVQTVEIDLLQESRRWAKDAR